MNGPYASTGQHRHNGFGDHGHVNCHSIPLPDSQGLQGIRKLTNFSVQLPVSQCLLITWLALENKGRLVLPMRP